MGAYIFWVAQPTMEARIAECRTKLPGAGQIMTQHKKEVQLCMRFLQIREFFSARGRLPTLTRLHLFGICSNITT